MTQSIDDLVSQAQERFAAAMTPRARKRKGPLPGQGWRADRAAQGAGQLDPEQKREMGAQINQAKKKVEEFLNLPRRAGASRAGRPSGF